MPKTKSITYQCPRCGYEINLKAKMKRHLFENKKKCPVFLNDIELTAEICNSVLDNHRYVPKNVITQKITQYNILNNFINQMEFDQKLQKLLNFQNDNLIEFGDKIEMKLAKRKERLSDNSYKTAYTMGENELVNLVDKLTLVNRPSLNTLNVLFDKKLKRMKIFQDAEWNSYVEEMGITEIINLMKSYYLDDYELYLIRSLHSENSNVSNRFDLRAHIDIYYKFLASFNLPICIFGLTDREILGHRLKEGNDYYLDEIYTNIYEDIKKKLDKTESNRIQKKIMKIVKDNTVHNISELNKALIDLLKVNSEFEKHLTITNT